MSKFSINSLLDKGQINVKTLIKLLRESGSEDNELSSTVEELKTIIGDENTADSILGRIKALENK